MSSATSAATITVALIGNPNTGKSTLFNALAGTKQRVGNFPGCTVEKKTGRMSCEGQAFELIDLPGTYSLSPRSPDEMVTVDVLLGRRIDAKKPDVLLCIVDASNLERNLYLVSQALELGLPTVLAMNMVDIAAARGLTIDVAKLSSQLGLPIVELQAHKKLGVDSLKLALLQAAKQKIEERESPFPPEFVAEMNTLRANLEQAAQTNSHAVLPRYLVERLLLDTSGYLAGAVLHPQEQHIPPQLETARQRLAEAGLPVPGVEAMSRYGWVARVLQGVVTRPKQRRVTASDKIDGVLTHKYVGTAIFVLLMLLVFNSVFSWASPAMDLIDGLFGSLGEAVEASMEAGPLRSLLVDGIVGGVGGVLIFLPQILILFFFIAILEDCGYMARAAFLMDKLMAGVGLSGKSFIPLLSSFACAIPGVMATRVIENPRDRLATILVAPLMSCSARLPVYVLLISAFVPPVVYVEYFLTLQGMTMAAMYGIGILAAVAMAFVLKKTLLRGETPPFVMELPSYKWPSLVTVLARMTERGWSFIRRAGTLILAVSILVWAASYYPHNAADVPTALWQQQTQLEQQIANLEKTAAKDDPTLEAQRAELQNVQNQIDGEFVRHSLLGRMGKVIEPAVVPLGWDWRIGSAAIASFPAREVIVAVLGVIYNLGEVDMDESVESADSPLKQQLRAAVWDSDSPRAGQKVYTLPVALSITVFFALCAQCAATLVVIKRETNSWRWPVFTFVYMTSLAYLAAFITYQVGTHWL